MVSPVLAAYGHIGAAVKTREYEDRHFAGMVKSGSGLDIALAMVADGVGGGNFGQRAAQLTVDSIIGYIQQATLNDLPQLLGKAIGEANRMVFDEALSDDGKAGMSCTVAIAAVVDGRLFIANVGDSRIYLISGKKIKQLSIDHIWAYERFRQGKLSLDEALRHPNAYMLTRSVGFEAKVKVDLGLYMNNGQENSNNAYQQQGLFLDDNEVVLVCTDGLIKNMPYSNKNYVSLEEITEAIESSHANQAVKLLVDIAVGREADDNVTAAIIEMPKHQISEHLARKRKFRLPWLKRQN